MNVKNYYDNNKSIYLNNLLEILQIPTISTDENFGSEIIEGAKWFDKLLRSLNFNSQIISTERHPIVYGERMLNSDFPTLLIYGHYDVQPAGNRAEWKSDPFTPEIRDSTIYGRGSSDDKGQLMSIISAIDVFDHTSDDTRLNFKVLIEGEEEIASPSLRPFLQKNKALLLADAILVCDTQMLNTKTPTITNGLRGILISELEISRYSTELHSGIYGGIVSNPAHILSNLCASIKDKNNHIQIPGFYDNVIEPSDSELNRIKNLPLSESDIFSKDTVKKFSNENGYTLLESIWYRPSADIIGMSSGFTNPGIKSIIPATATVKFYFRLVNGQSPDEIQDKLVKYIEQALPEYYSYNLKTLGSCLPISFAVDSVHMKSAEVALNKVYGTNSTQFVKEGGSIPIISWFKEILNIESVMMGFGLKSDNIHGSNEHFSISRFDNAVLSITTFFKEFQRKSSK